MHSPVRPTASWGARTGLAALAGGLLAAAALAGAPSAQAADDYLQVSLDGDTFGTSVSGAVFTEGVRLVPGEGSTASVWIRNAGPEAAFLSVAAVSRDMDSELLGHLSLAATPASINAGTGELGPAGTCTDLDLGTGMPAGTDRRLDLAAGLTLAAPNNTMNKRGSFDLVFLLEAAGEGNRRSACDGVAGGDRPVQLPQTGASPGSSPAAPTDGAATLVVQGTPAAANAPVFAGPALQAAPAGLPARPAAQPPAADVPADVEPASFIESTVEPIIRTWQGTLMVLLAVGFFAAAAARSRISRKPASA
ncbi:hypothetical protein [Arthrobacter sp. 7Tela_A1]|uniref:hypothetical protein n=1 Tax=Arthrobacter sp. 7Tela_A1 TaxID=3093745 RepID=UPI003BB6989D